MKKSAVGLLFVSLNLYAANIAIIDSGVDYKHQDLKAKMWTNPNSETKDVDGKVYKDDTNGWNFAENNNQIIDYKYLGTFSSDCTKIFDVQAKILQNTASEEEKSWYKAKKGDQSFLKELQKFGNFVHGTHVSGISSAQADESKLIGMKLIPTETPGSSMAFQLLKTFRGNLALNNLVQDDNPLAKMYLKMLAQRQAEMLITVGKFTAAVESEVANGSFGTSVAAVKPILKNFLTQILGKEPTEQELTDYTVFFVQEIADASKEFTEASKNTLFVFAAGNDGTDNDKLPTSPANIKTDNTIAVAATNGFNALASFSNFGEKNVEVAAPGVAILSTIPGDAKLAMSGTSMAAPYVTNVAALVKDANHSLTPADIKKILVTTVDVKDFLKGKVKSSGIVNKARAVRAAQLARGLSIEAAVSLSRVQVADEATNTWGTVDTSNEKDLIVLPLPSLF